jgi:PAS domain S-box-containing protein
MGFRLEEFLNDRREAIVTEWVDRLMKEVGVQYAKRPRQELIDTVSAAFEANFNVLVNDDFATIDRFIQTITTLRLEAGFRLSDVQMAFEIFRSITLPLIAAETTADEFLPLVTNINRCLTYTIHRFSDHFQTMHQEKILEHNRRLEEMVQARTAQLEESQRKYKTLVEEINDGYFVVQDEIVVFANSAFCKMHGYDLCEVIGAKFYTFIDLDSRAQVIHLYEKSLREKTKPRTFEYLRLTKNGKICPTEILAKVTYYENKLSSIGICRDITQRVKLERKIRESERMAYIGQVTTSLSHEIRNPLSSVQMNLQILKKHPQLKGNDQKRIDICVREVQRLENILKELLDFAKPIQLRYQRFSLVDLLYFSIELLAMRFKEKRISIATDFDPHLPEIRADKDKLGQALINLLLNALEASPQGGCIKVGCRQFSQAEGGILVEVSDQGCGIPDGCAENIFEPFFTTKSKGTGLGLNNVKRIINAHKGEIEFENLDPCGAAFRILLPSG